MGPRAPPPPPRGAGGGGGRGGGGGGAGGRPPPPERLAGHGGQDERILAAGKQDRGMGQLLRRLPEDVNGLVLERIKLAEMQEGHAEKSGRARRNPLEGEPEQPG